MDVLEMSVSLAWDVTISAGRMHNFQVSTYNNDYNYGWLHVCKETWTVLLP